MNNEKIKKTIIIIIAIVLVICVIVCIVLRISSNIVTTTSQEQVKDTTELMGEQASTLMDYKKTMIKDQILQIKQKYMFNEVGERRTPKELERAINNELSLRFGPEYTITISEDYEVTYNFEVE